MRRLFGAVSLALMVLGSAALPAVASPVDTQFVDPCDYPEVYGPCTPRSPWGPIILY